MTRKLSKFVIFAITILFATLVKDYIIKILNDHIDKGLIGVLIIMAVTLAIYYPLFTFVDKYVKKLAEGYVKGAKGAVKSSINGLLIGFIIAMLIVFSFGAYIWFDINIIDTIL